MAKMTVTVDTETKEIKATVDGQNIENVTSISVYCDPKPGKYSYCSFEVRTTEPGEKCDSYKSTTYCASGSEIAKASVNGDPQKFFDSIFKKNK